MTADLLSDDILKLLEKGNLSPCYLFYGPEEFRRERVLSRIREEFLPESTRDFNLEICYGGEADPYDIMNRASSSPFMVSRRLIIVRRTEEFKAEQLEKFLPYLEEPVISTCLIFVSSRPDFKKRFYKKMRSSGWAVNFAALQPYQIGPWIRKTAKELGMNISRQACLYLQQIVGDRLDDIYSELFKLRLRYREGDVGEEEVRELAIHSRLYSIFELVNAISVKDRGESLSVLSRFLEEEDKRSGPLQIIGMINRQLGLLWRTKAMKEKGINSKQMASKLGVQPFAAGKLVKQSTHWSVNDLEYGISQLHRADRLLKSGSRPRPVLECLVLSLCG